MYQNCQLSDVEWDESVNSKYMYHDISEENLNTIWRVTENCYTSHMEELSVEHTVYLEILVIF